MPKKKLKWTDVDDIAFRLIDEHPSINPMKLSPNSLKEYVTKLPEFSDDPKKAKDSTLEAIQKVWFDERSEMDDELGPFASAEESDEELDEDDYRDDKMVDDEDSGLFDTDDEDEDEDELEEGFQEEEIGD